MALQYVMRWMGAVKYAGLFMVMVRAWLAEMPPPGCLQHQDDIQAIQRQHDDPAHAGYRP